jgi:Protein of unknown function (DUF2630)
MDDAGVLERITELAEEEHLIFQREGRNEATASDRARLKEIEVTLDQCWDLLHQRRAARAAGGNPDDVEVRDPKTVEGYVS